MKRLTKSQVEGIEAYRLKLEDSRRIAEEAVEKAQSILQSALDEVNETREEAAELLRELWGKADDTINERSDAWRDSEAGDTYITAALIEAWGGE